MSAFYEWHGEKTFHAGDWIDCSDYLDKFTNGRVFSADIDFSTQDAGYLTLFSIFYKESAQADFAICLQKGRVVLITRDKAGSRMLTGGEALCDGERHVLSFRATENGWAVWTDGQKIVESSIAPYCSFGYVGFACIGRGTVRDEFGDFFEGTLYHVAFSQEDMPLSAGRKTPCTAVATLFANGVNGCANYRIPNLLTTTRGTVIASADARMEAAGDNPNHILRAVRTSKDSGRTWSEISFFCDFGGAGRIDGAAALDGALLEDCEQNRVFMLFCHTSAGIGSAKAEAGTGFDSQGRKMLWNSADEPFFSENGQVVSPGGARAEEQVDAMGRIVRDGCEIGSICHGEQRIYRQANTCFLKLTYSDDEGKTWCPPIDLNVQVKAEWMKFIGAGPGCGLQITEGDYKGRLVFPIYFSTCEGAAYSCAAIYSDDHGQSWKRGASVNDGRIYQGEQLSAKTAQDATATVGECQIVEEHRGGLCIFMRNSMGHVICTAHSADGGATWQEFRQQSELPNPDCQCSVLRVKDGKQAFYLFSGPQDARKRVRGVLMRSEDGEHWARERMIEPGEFGYSCMALLPDGALGVLYEGRDLALNFMRIPLA